MQSKRGEFEVIDLDPYGTAAPFIDSAVCAISTGGLLCVTCTDMAVLAGTYPETALAKYGGTSMRSKFCHEHALRLLLNAIEAAANRNKRFIKPILSCSIDYYVRVFVQVFESPSEVKRSGTKRSFNIVCGSCGSFWNQPLIQILPSRSGKGERISNGRAVGVMTSGKCSICDSAVHVSEDFSDEPLNSKDRRAVLD